MVCLDYIVIGWRIGSSSFFFSGLVSFCCKTVCAGSSLGAFIRGTGGLIDWLVGCFLVAVYGMLVLFLFMLLPFWPHRRLEYV